MRAANVSHLAPIQSAESGSVRRFVQGFYDWYTPKAFGSGDAELAALKTKSEMFTPELRRALLEDWKASSENADEIVGLDFDPFLNSQDPYTKYLAEKVEKKGASWLVSVYGSSKEGKSAVADVIAKVEKTKGKYGWRFTNFIYDKSSNLLGVLREFKKEREKKK